MDFCVLLEIWYVSKRLISKYSQKLIDHAKESATDALKIASKKSDPKKAEATGDLIGNKIADTIKRVWIT